MALKKARPRFSKQEESDIESLYECLLMDIERGGTSQGMSFEGVLELLERLKTKFIKEMQNYEEFLNKTVE